MKNMLAALAAPVIDAAQRDYTEARDRYRAALNFAATCSPVHRPRAMQAVEVHAARHALAFTAQQVVCGGPVDLSDPRD
jgi:hypothetical protein